MSEPKTNPAPLVEIVYVKDVFSPDYKSGKKDETKAIERHWAEQLVTDGYAQYVQPAAVETAVIQTTETNAESESADNGNSE